MLKMSFSNKTLKRDELVGFIQTTTKPILYTYGFAYRHPTTYKKPITVDEAIQIAKNECFLDADEYDEYLHLNAFSSNDLF